MGILQPEKNLALSNSPCFGFSAVGLYGRYYYLQSCWLKGYFGAGKGLRIDDWNSHDHAACEIKKKY